MVIGLSCSEKTNSLFGLRTGILGGAVWFLVEANFF